MHEAWPKAHHMAPPDLAIRQRQLCSGARPSAQPKSLARRDRNRFRSLQGRVTTATPIPRELDFMHGWMTSRHEGCVSTMLTESGLSIALPVRHFKGLVRRNGRVQADKHGISGAFRLDNAGPARPIARPAARSHILARRMRRQDYPSLISKPFAQGLPRRARCYSAEAATHRSETGSRANRERR